MAHSANHIQSVHNKEVKFAPKDGDLGCVPLSVLERVCIIDVFSEEMYEHFVGTEETVSIRRVSV